MKHYEKTILIIDDNEDARELMSNALSKEGYNNIIFAETGEKGLEKVR